MTLHPQAVAAIALSRGEPSLVGADHAEITRRRREALDAAAAEPREPVAEVVDLDADGVPCRLFHPEGAGGGAIVFAHGGGFVFGDLDTHDAQSRRIANRTRMTVLAVDYRRPPEHVYPAAADDVATAARWLAAGRSGRRWDRIVSLGDSAGADLALVAALREPGLFAACVLVYPFIDPRLRGASMATEGEHGFSRAEAGWYWECYAGGTVAVEQLLGDPGFCPLDAPGLGGLPPTQVLVAEHDILRSEGLLLAERIRAGGGTVSVVGVPGMIHGFWRHPAQFDAAEPAYAATVSFLDGV